jgi:outer membrane protein OmpA-like peptidoglycan-associated protein
MSKAWFSLIFASFLFFASPVSWAQSEPQKLSPSAAPPAAADPAPSATPAGGVEIGNELKTGTLKADQDEMAGGREQWFIGAYWRHLWVPRFIEKIFFKQAPSISTGLFKLQPNLGLVATWRTASGFAVQFGLGHLSYHFDGYFRSKNDPAEATEAVKSNLDFWHGTAAVLWSAEVIKELAFEFGLGIDLGLFTGDIERTEAYYDPRGWHVCDGPLLPSIKASSGVPYCNKPVNGTDTDPSNKSGEHYHVKVKKMGNGGSIPPVFLIPTVPMATVRFAPTPELIIKWEVGYSIVEFWTGASIHYALWTEPAPPPAPAELRVVEKPAIKGQVKGTVVEEGTTTPILNASIVFVARPELSPILTLADGSFTSYEFEPGEIAMEVSHPDYESNGCNAMIGRAGGEVQTTCTLVLKPKVGIVDGYVFSSSGPVARAKIELIGPMTRKVISDTNGAFKVGDAVPGEYTARIIADKYMVKMTSFAVAVKETTNVKVELTEMPAQSLVTVGENEIKIEQQINFATNSATIKPDSTSLMTQIADAFLRYPDIRLVEIQGHTDSRGNDKYNLDLSQRRADSVRAWLINAGVAADRIEAKGYGETQPLTSNKTREGRARNRRVQFMIQQRTEEHR